MAISGLDDGAGNIYSPPVEPVAPPPPPPPAPVVGPQPYFPEDEFEPAAAAGPVALNVPPPPNPTVGLTAFGPADEPVTNSAPPNPTVGLTAFGPADEPVTDSTPPNPTVGLTEFGPADEPVTHSAPPNPTVGLTAFDPGDAPVPASAVGQPIDPRAPDKRYDGAIVGGDGRVYPPGTSLHDLPAVLPDFGDGNEPLYIFVNGVGNNIATQQDYMRATANATGARVIGIHNGTDGKPTDIAQAAGDKLGLSDNPARNTLATAIIDELDHGRPVHVAAHSQGAIITSGALNSVWAHYQEQGLSDDEIRAKLANVQVETYGGAATLYPDGPQYVHFINYWDPVARLGVQGSPGAGAGAKLVPINNPAGLTSWPIRPLEPHSYTNVYLPVREGKTFEQIYNDR